MTGPGYTPADLVPFTADVYLRLIERTGEAFWPLHFLTLALGLVALGLALFNQRRTAAVLLAAAWAWTGVTFLMDRYSQLNWAGEYFGWAFLAQAGLLLLMAVSGKGLCRVGHDWTVPRLTGLMLAGAGLLAYPLVAPLGGHGWFHAEVFGIHPDPTAIVTLGILLCALRGPGLWIAATIPILWCLTTGLTLQVLGLPWAAAPFAAVAVVLSGMIWKTIVHREASRNTGTHRH